MIVELTGIPGAGKSTLLASLQKIENRTPFVFDIQRFILNNSWLPFNGKIAYEVILYFKVYTLRSADITLLKNVFFLMKNSGNSLFSKLNILRNTLKKILIFNAINNRKEIFFIDEGIAHIPFTLFVDINKTINTEDVKNIFLNTPVVDKLLIVDAPDNVLLDRVIDRGKKGHRRMNFDSKDDVKKFMQQSRDILELIKLNYDAVIYENVDKSIDSENILNKLGL